MELGHIIFAGIAFWGLRTLLPHPLWRLLVSALFGLIGFPVVFAFLMNTVVGLTHQPWYYFLFWFLSGGVGFILGCLFMRRRSPF